MFNQGNRPASSFEEACSVSIAMSIGTYSLVSSAWMRMRVLAWMPLPNSISSASGPTNCAMSAMLPRRMAVSVLTSTASELQPLTYASRVADTRASAPGVKQHDDNRTPGQRHLHHQAPSRLGDISGLGQADIPARAAGQIVGIAEAHHAAPDFHVVRGRGRVVADLRIRVRGLDQLRQVLRGRHVATGEARSVLESSPRHA